MGGARSRRLPGARFGNGWASGTDHAVPRDVTNALIRQGDVASQGTSVGLNPGRERPIKRMRVFATGAENQQSGAAGRWVTEGPAQGTTLTPGPFVRFGETSPDAVSQVPRERASGLTRRPG